MRQRRFVAGQLRPEKPEPRPLSRWRGLLRAMATLMMVCAGPVAHAQEIRVTLLGTGAPPPVMDRFGPSILVEAGSERMLFDAGRGAAQRFFQLGMPLREVTGVFLTHFHSDHTVGLPDLWLTGWLNPQFGGRRVPLQVRGPAGTVHMMDALTQAFEADIRIRIADQGYGPEGAAVMAEDVTEGVVLDRNGVRVTAFDVDHGELIKPALGYRVDYRGRSVVLSGDTRFSDNLIRFAAGADVVIHEVAGAPAALLERSEPVRRIIDHHTRPEEAGVVFERVMPRLAVYSHIVMFGDAASPPLSLEELVALTRTAYSGRLEVGEDLMRIEIGETIEVRRFNPPR